jgi:hypothetical protein
MILDTGYLTSSIGASISTVQTFRVNLRQVLGDMYDEYDTFAICLNSVLNYAQISSYNTIPNVGSVSSTLPVKVGMSGLNWMSSTLNGNKESLCFFPNAFVIGGAGTASDGGYGSGNFKNPNCIMFKKPPEPNVEFTVGLYSARQNGFVRGGNTSGESRIQLNYNFSIFGITEVYY